MATPSQRDVINEIKTQQALMKQDLGYLKKSQDALGKQLDVAIASIASLSFVTIKEFEDYKRFEESWRLVMESRVKNIEDYNDKNSPGLRFSNDIAGNLLRVLALVTAVAILGLAAKYVITGGR